MDHARPLSAAVLLTALTASGCATMTVGQRVTGASQDPTLLDLCVFTPGGGALDRNVAQFTMSDAVGASVGAPSLGLKRDFVSRQAFRSAAYVRDLDDSSGCDVMLKVIGRSFLPTRMPAELYSARTKQLLKRFDASVNGPGGSAALAYEALRPGAGLYERVMQEAGRQPQALASAPMRAASPAPAVNPATGLSREELRQMMAEAVKAAVPPAAVSAPAAQPSSDADTPSYRKPPNIDDFAVVVGVEKYNGLPDASYAERDAKAVYEHLVALGYPRRNIALLTGAQATRTGLVKNIEAWLPQNINERSSVVFYYSGHGAPDPTGGTAYLVPSDGDPQYLEETAYPVKRLYEKLSALKAKRVLVAMDSCFSGAGGRSVLAKGTRPLVGKIDLGSVGGKVVSLTASSSSQISGTEEAQGHGLFTYYLLRGLNGEAKDASGGVTVKSLHAYLAPLVQDTAKRVNRDQTPQLLPPAPADDFKLR